MAFATMLILMSLPAFAEPLQNFTFGGNSPWSLQTTVTHDGTDAHRSGSISHNQSSWMQTTVTGPGAVRFWWKVSSESYYDRLTFNIDGTAQGNISGAVDWQSKAIDVPSGNHTLRWTYSTDGSILSGSNAGWVDQITFEPGSNFDFTSPVTTATPAGGVYSSSRSVTLTANEAATIYYTTSNSLPTTAWPQYSSPISISNPTILKFFAVDTAGNAELVRTASYSFETVPPNTTTSIPGGTYSETRNVALYCSDSGSYCNSTYYCLGSGCNPTTPYSGAISIAASTDLRFYSTDRAGNSEAVKTVSFIITPVTTANPPAGSYYMTQNVNLTANKPATIFYTTNGSDPVTSPSRQEYTVPVSISLTTTLKFYAVDAAGNSEAVKTAVYSIFGRVSGRVTDSITGAGIQGLSVALYDAATGNSVSSVNTDSSGVYSSSNLSAGTYKIRFSGGDYLSQWYGNQADISRASTVSVIVGSTTTGINAVLEKGGIITGRVTDSATGTGKAGVCVSLYNDVNGTLISHIHTDTSGNYGIANLPTGTYKLKFTADGYFERWHNGKISKSTADIITVNAPDTVSGINMAMEKGAVINGIVTDKSNSAVRIFGVSVDAYDSVTGAFVKSGYSDRSGAYSIRGLVNGSYKLKFYMHPNTYFHSNGDASIVTTGGYFYERQPYYYSGSSITISGGSVTIQNQNTGTLVLTDTANAVLTGGISISSSTVNLTNTIASVNTQNTGTLVLTDSINAVLTGGSNTSNSTGTLNNQVVALDSQNNGSLVLTDNISAVLTVSSYAIPSTISLSNTLASVTTENTGSLVLTDNVSAVLVSGNNVVSPATVQASPKTVAKTLSRVAPACRTITFTGKYLDQWYNNKNDKSTSNAVAVTPPDTVSGINVEMAIGGAITGTVYDSVTDVGIQGVSVYAFNADSDTSASSTSTRSYVGFATTDSSGGYSISGLKTGNYKLSFSGSGYLKKWSGGMTDQSTATSVSVTVPNSTPCIDMFLDKGAVISGTITDKDTGAGLLYIFVNAYDAVTGAYVSSALSSSSGSYSISGLASGSYKIGFAMEPILINSIAIPVGYNTITPTTSQNSLVTTTTGSVPLVNASVGSNTILAPNNTVTAQLVSNTIPSTVSLSSTVASLNTQNSGSLVLTDNVSAVLVSGNNAASAATPQASPKSVAKTLAKDAPACRTIAVTGRYAEQWYSSKGGMSSANVIEVTAPNTISGINAAMEFGGSITGTVYDSVTDIGIQGVSVYVYDAGSDRSVSATSINSHVFAATTDSSGGYSISGLKTGNYILRFSHSDYLVKWSGGMASQATAATISVTMPNTTACADISMSRGGSISGTVTDRITGAGISNVYLYAIDRSSGDWAAAAHTDSSGNYAIKGLASGSYRVRIAHSDYSGHITGDWYGGQNSYICADSVAVSAPNATIDVNVQLDMGGSISGRVTDASTGTGIPGASISLIGSTTQAGRYVYADTGGNYTISGLSSGDYSLAFFAADYIKPKTRTTVSVTAPARVTSIDTVLTRGSGIRGRVTDNLTAAGIGHIFIDAYATDTNEILGSTISDDYGNFIISGLPSGSYRLRYYGSDSGYADGWYNIQTSTNQGAIVSVAASVVTTDINLSVIRRGGISGRVTDSADNLLQSRTTVTAYDGISGAHVGSTITDNDGRYLLAGLPTGSYRVMFTNTSLASDNYLHYWYGSESAAYSRAEVRVQAPTITTGINARLVKAGTIAGVLAVNICPAPQSVTIKAYDADNDSLVGSTTVNTSYSDHFTIRALPPRNYKLAFIPNVAGFIRQWYPNKTEASSAEPVTVNAGSITGNINMTLTAGGGSIAGTVNTCSGSSFALASLKLYDWYSSGLVAEGSTGHGITYLLSGLADGSYKLFYKTRQAEGWYRTPGESAQASPLVVSGGSPLVGIDIAENCIPDGDVDGSGGAPGLKDVIKLLRVTVGLEEATPEILAHGDVAPTMNGVSMPDGRITVSDVILLLQRIVSTPVVTTYY